MSSVNYENYPTNKEGTGDFANKIAQFSAFILL